MVWLCLTPFAPRSTFLREERRDAQPGDIRAYLGKPELASGASLDQQAASNTQGFRDCAQQDCRSWWGSVLDTLLAVLQGEP